MGRLSKYDKQMDKEIKDLEKFIHKIKKKEWISKGFKPPWDKNKRKPKKISDVTKGINVIDKKLDKIINENVKLKEEISDIKAEQKKQKELKIKKEIIDKPKSFLQLQIEGGGIIDPVAHEENEKLKVKLEKDKKKKKVK